jgi:hypothetical protein
METLGVFGTAALVAGLLTLFELDRTFYVPKAAQDRAKLWGWVGFFVIVNGVIASVTAAVLRTNDSFASWQWAVQGLAAGLSYMAVVRVKIATLKFGQEDVNVGVELIYDYAKDYVFKRINKIAKAARRVEVGTLISECTLVELVLRARQEVLYDELLTPAQSIQLQQWILSVVEPDDLTEDEQKLFLANYVCSGRQVSRPVAPGDVGPAA